MYSILLQFYIYRKQLLNISLINENFQLPLQILHELRHTSLTFPGVETSQSGESLQLLSHIVTISGISEHVIPGGVLHVSGIGSSWHATPKNKTLE